MPATVDEAARELIEQQGRRAVYIAVEKLNQSIDERDGIGRDFWAQVVRAIHEHQGSIKRKKPVRSKAQKSGPELPHSLKAKERPVAAKALPLDAASSWPED